MGGSICKRGVSRIRFQLYLVSTGECRSLAWSVHFFYILLVLLSKNVRRINRLSTSCSGPAGNCVTLALDLSRRRGVVRRPDPASSSPGRSGWKSRGGSNFSAYARPRPIAGRTEGCRPPVFLNLANLADSRALARLAHAAKVSRYAAFVRASALTLRSASALKSSSVWDSS